MAKRAAQFPDPADWHALRAAAAAVRARTLAKLPELLEKLAIHRRLRGAMAIDAESLAARKSLSLIVFIISDRTR